MAYVTKSVEGAILLESKIEPLPAAPEVVICFLNCLVCLAAGDAKIFTFWLINRRLVLCCSFLEELLLGWLGISTVWEPYLNSGSSLCKSLFLSLSFLVDLSFSVWYYRLNRESEFFAGVVAFTVDLLTGLVTTLVSFSFTVISRCFRVLSSAASLLISLVAELPWVSGCD